MEEEEIQVHENSIEIKQESVQSIENQFQQDDLPQVPQIDQYMNPFMNASPEKYET